MARNEEKSKKPRELVHRAQAQVAKWEYQLMRSRHGLDGPDTPRCRRELHSAIMMYWSQISRFSHRSHISDEWEAPIDELGGDSLADLGDLRLATVQERTTEKDETGRASPTTVEKPWVMNPGVALAVRDQLDKCAHELGFDASPKRQRETYGWEEPAEEEMEDTDGTTTTAD